MVKRDGKSESSSHRVGKSGSNEGKKDQAQASKNTKEARNGNKLEKKKGIKATGGGMDEIESLFEKKKRTKAETKIQSEKRKRRKVNTVNTQMQQQGEWTDDGLGGKFNAEGFTGRVQDGCKIFKAHVLNKPNFGYSKDCPFDCDCCFI